MSAPVLVHVGYHKTATTWLQRSVFVPALGWHPLLDHREVAAQLVHPHGLTFDAAAARALIADRLAAVPAGRAPVISSEILSGNPFFGGRESDVLADRLAACLPGARILVTIRNQMKLLPSLYMQYLRRGGTMPAGAFFAGTDEPGYFGFSPEHFDFDRLVARYQALFGPEAVLVVAQEEVARDPAAVAARLARFAGNDGFPGLPDAARRPVGVSYPEYAVPVLRRVNHLRTGMLNPAPVLPIGRGTRGLYRAVGRLATLPPLPRLCGGFRPVSALVAARFAGRFEASNARLAALVAHPLDLAGYPMPRAGGPGG